MAKVGLRYPVFAPIQSEQEGTMPVYGKGVVIGHAISADISFTKSESKLYADDRVVEADNTITGGSITLGVDDVSDAVQVAMLGVREETEEGTKVYIDGGTAAPYGGFGYIRVQRLNGVTKYISYWVYKVMFGKSDETANTKGESLEWQTPTLSAEMMGVNIGGNDVDFRKHASFETFEAAKAWVDKLAKIAAA